MSHAYHPQDERHGAAKTWLEGVLSGIEPVGFAWLTLWAFLRVSTNTRVFERPLQDDQVKGGLIMDAALAALALEHGAILHTTDGDFSRFSGLSWRNPLDTA